MSAFEPAEWRAAQVQAGRAQIEALEFWLAATGDLLELLGIAGHEGAAPDLRLAAAAVRSTLNDLTDEVSRLELGADPGAARVGPERPRGSAPRGARVGCSND